MDKNIYLPKIQNRYNYSNVEIDNELSNKNIEQAFKNINKAKFMIKNRMDKLLYESEILKSMKLDNQKYNKDIGMLYGYNNLSKGKNHISNPNLYSYGNLDPIYYPLEMPINGEPVKLPQLYYGETLKYPQSKGDKGKLNIQNVASIISLFKNMK